MVYLKAERTFYAIKDIMWIFDIGDIRIGKIITERLRDKYVKEGKIPVDYPVNAVPISLLDEDLKDKTFVGKIKVRIINMICDSNIPQKRMSMLLDHVEGTDSSIPVLKEAVT